MPAFETLPRFTADLQHLTPARRRRFRRVVPDAFVPDLRPGRQFRPGSREARGFANSRAQWPPNLSGSSSMGRRSGLVPRYRSAAVLGG
ncbi:hypothetical protein D9753_00665 [Streptomyces dangxiongensis]|uniref:Uncharacterized protein n=1 Tax=Streptomyces dangxiongensis TaxID=1442032 RepID=A0A3G2J6C6_9ACTN|nr:hypothetical protein D9753_00665 [Streptomyces dangxiongensis]